MAAAKRRITLGIFMRGDGHHISAWKRPESGQGGLEFAQYRRVAQTAEHGKFDFMFLQDQLTVPPRGIVSHRCGDVVELEPLTVLSALSAVTRGLGLVATVSTTYWEPFHVARLFASLDHISAGRAAWNVVTSVSSAEAGNFGSDMHLPHSLRYDRAREFVDVVKGLWDSWEDDAFIRDKEEGIYFDREKMHTLSHKGKYLSVVGPLNVSRPPQGHPVIFQAGASDTGRKFAARTAEVVFTVQTTLPLAQEFYADLKARAGGYGRDPEEIKIIPGLFPVIGHTAQAARDKLECLQLLVDEQAGLALLSSVLGTDLSRYPLDGPVPDLAEPNGGRGRFKLVTNMARKEQMTIRQLYQSYAPARGHHVVVGTYKQIADVMEEWLMTGGADGFLVLPPLLPEDLQIFVDRVVPELQRRDLFRKEYEGRTLRENLGLPRPMNRFHNAGQDWRWSFGV